ncbi:DUF3500 domain-containing protein [Streptomyces sp. NPDC058642]|uniref:DUF3500 domain-containing protein n=1 Tax=Streptomyces sp. NPDC058642 TaxID=3346572 RepID=UPI003649A457
MGKPSTSKPWGFQYEAHHLGINYFALGDQVVMTLTFMGPEPTSATCDGGKVTTFKTETKSELTLLRSLTSAQQEKVISSETKDSSAFNYRIHSPVVLIEYDAQSPIAYETQNRNPTQQHIHTIIRTPNGSYYGVDLLRLHLENDH